MQKLFIRIEKWSFSSALICTSDENAIFSVCMRQVVLLISSPTKPMGKWSQKTRCLWYSSQKVFQSPHEFLVQERFAFLIRIGQFSQFVAFGKYLLFVRVLSLATTSELTNKGDKSTELFFFSLNKTLIFHYEIHNKSQKKAFRAWDKKCGKEEIIFK